MMRVSVSAGWILLVTGMLALGASAQQADLTSPSAKPELLGFAPGDTLKVEMYDFPEIKNEIEVNVSSGGAITLPYAGAVKVAGMMPDQAEQAIDQVLKSKNIVRDPSVTLTVISSQNLRVYVTGEVRKPSFVPLTAPAPLSYVLAQTEGFTGLEGRHITILHRTNMLPTFLDLDSQQPSAQMMNTLVYPGDIINVEHIGTIFMVGELMKPGTYPLTGALSVGSGLAGIGAVRHMTLLQALAMAGGVTEIAARSKSILLRTKPDGTREKIMIDIVKLEKGEIADPVLRAGDIFYVPSSYLRNLTNNLFLNLVNAMYVLPALTVVGLP